MNILRHRIGIRSRGERFKGGGMVVYVHAVLLNAFSSSKTSSLLEGFNNILIFEYILKVKAIVPGSPYVVVLVDDTGRSGGGDDGITEKWIYTQTETMPVPWNQAEEMTSKSGGEDERNLVAGRLSA
jgi:hypothetical protein